MADEDNTNNTIPPEEPSQQTPPVMESNDTTGGGNFTFDEPAEDPDDAALNRRGSSLGGGSGKAITFGAAMLIGTGVILYYLFSESPPPPQATETGVVPTKPSGELISTPASSAPSNVSIASPALPSAPPAPPPPPPPPPPPAPPAAVKAKDNSGPPKPQAPLAPPDIKAITPSAADNARTAAVDRRSAQRMRSNMLLVNGGGKAAAAGQKAAAQSAVNSNDPNAAFASNAIAASAAEKEMATKLTNMHTLIAQGKIVNAVLETAINTDLPGTLRAVISRDVYAEAGKNILIPKGSRLIGTYNTGILRGQKRVMIVWTRVITPVGVDIQIGSPGVDSLGRAGMEGFVDNKFMETFSAAILTSMITLGVGVAGDALVSDTGTTSSNTDGSTTSSGSAGVQGVNEAARSLGAVGRDIVANTLDIRPTITIDQGSRINVFVNRDLVMPGSTESGSLFVQ